MFFFFVVLSADARNSWLTLLCPCKFTKPSTTKSHLRYTGDTSSIAKQGTLSSDNYSSVKLEKSAQKEELSHEMVRLGHSVIDEKEEDRDNLPDLATVETTLSETKFQGILQQNLEDPTKRSLDKVLNVRTRLLSTKTHHIETAEVDFNDQFSDESDTDVYIGNDMQRDSEKPQQKPQQDLHGDHIKGAKGKVFNVRMRLLSTKTHHIETAEVDFSDHFSDESDVESDIFP